MLLDYHSLYHPEPAPAPAPPFVWLPRKRKSKVRITGTIDAGLPVLQSESAATVHVAGHVGAVMAVTLIAVAATASTLRPTDIRDIDLDAQEGGWTDELLLAVGAMLLLDEFDDD